jgi:hypothetical protein
MYVSSLEAGRLLRILHFIGAAAVIFGTLVASRVTARYYLVFWLAVLGLHVVFRGCILSRLERHLTQEDVTIVDPLLNITGLEVNKKNRNVVSLAVQIIMVIIAMGKGHMAPL